MEKINSDENKQMRVQERINEDNSDDEDTWKRGK